nr:MAG TPA: hypothetical protein [Caudoviricetes sp.]
MNYISPGIINTTVSNSNFKCIIVIKTGCYL